MEIQGTWYTTAQAAEKLGLSHDAVRAAIRVGALEAKRVNPRLNLVSEEAIERYRRDHLGKVGRPTRSRQAENPQGCSTEESVS